MSRYRLIRFGLRHGGRRYLRHGVRRYLRRRLPSARRVLLVGLLAGALVTAVAALARRHA